MEELAASVAYAHFRRQRYRAEKAKGSAVAAATGCVNKGNLMVAENQPRAEIYLW